MTCGNTCKVLFTNKRSKASPYRATNIKLGFFCEYKGHAIKQRIMHIILPLLVIFEQKFSFKLGKERWIIVTALEMD
jgi:hypothetical protein